MDTVLILLKIDLGITHNLRDEYFLTLLISCEQELAGKGIRLNLTDSQDQILLSDYAAWQYRKRTEDTPLSNNLKWRIRNRIVKGRANGAN